MQVVVVKKHCVDPFVHVAILTILSAHMHPSLLCSECGDVRQGNFEGSGSALCMLPLLPLLRCQAILVLQRLSSPGPLGSSRPVNLSLIASSHGPSVYTYSHQYAIKKEH